MTANNLPIIVVGFDRTLHHYEGWQGPDIFGEPLVGTGAQRVLSRLYNDGWTIAISTKRPVSVHLWYWLLRHGFPWHYLNGWGHDVIQDSMARSGLHANNLEQLAVSMKAIQPGTGVLSPRPWPFNSNLLSGHKPMAHVTVDGNDWLHQNKFIQWNALYEILVYKFYKRQQITLPPPKSPKEDRSPKVRVFIAGHEVGVAFERQYEGSELINLEGITVQSAKIPPLLEKWATI